MPIRNLLIQLWSYPVRTPDNVMSAALEIAKMLGSRVTAAICKVDRQSATRDLGMLLPDVSAVVAAAEREGESATGEIEAYLLKANTGQYQPIDILKFDCPADIRPRGLIGLARLSDLIVVPIPPGEASHDLAQDLIFASGRPVLLLPSDVSSEISLAVVVVAWDGSRVAARAISDALPLLRFSQTVKLVEITGDKPLEGSSSTKALSEKLLTHDVRAEIDTVSADGTSASAALARYCSLHHADLLVMGAYGHSRTRDFFVGGVTTNFVENPPLPVLLSH